MKTARPITVSLPMGLFSAAPFSITQSLNLKSESKVETVPLDRDFCEVPVRKTEIKIWKNSTFQVDGSF